MEVALANLVNLVPRQRVSCLSDDQKCKEQD